MNNAGYMICASAKSSRYVCANCRARIEVSPYGQARIKQFNDEGKTMLLLCNPCGNEALAAVNKRVQTEPQHQATLEILHGALEAIADRDPELAKQIFRADAATRAAEAKKAVKETP